jgi:hypothetical protein
MDPPSVSLRELLAPDRDASFASVVNALSGPETGPRGDNFVTNEDSFARVAGAVGRRVPPGGVYLGVGPDQNFTFVAHARPALSVIVDYRRRNLLLHLLHRALFTLAEDRVAYLSRLTARRPGAIAGSPDAEALVRAFADRPLDREWLDGNVADVRRTLEPLGVVRADEWAELETIGRRLAGPGMAARFLALPMYPTLGDLIRAKDREGWPAHFLARDEWYRAVRERQVTDRVVPAVGDWAGPDLGPRLGGWLRRHRLAVSLIYVSDVEFFLLRAGRFADYLANLEALPWAEGAQLIRTSTRPLEGHPGRVPGDDATTILRPVAGFLKAARAGRVAVADDLFAPEGGG